MSMEWVLGVAMALVSTLGSLFIRSLQKDITDLESAVERIKNDYQRREDARRDQDSVMAALRDLKNTIERIDNKLDRKADK
ncbi:hypothetical protein GZ59_24550 [Pectobacterium atrosepticum]|uniref:hypothetical protein n=1 Tax=Pectobacterium atrosepticum TaxID=29471 RepID=UPI0004E84D2C|nr:hypothetical protein [Pectobacterium atrosepticum]AIK14252.1 hypothetical protein GZ59_24550 [Pectobacterium atrosepticum]ATY91679.1 hypothetical protein CVS35_15590 [Pectobacterium atrosepticum]KFX13261.1 hypothetical protein JV34_15690 [Pectobacterium atrosepticum]KMK81972.1 hypothetical protein KCQ_08006 [Pectobacterium atrosepticum ICMP 1526]QXE15247.1 hypothetical protein DCX48_12415 [Pectobacterium atrosepticum]